MAGEILTTVAGSLTADPEIKFLPTGAAVCSFTIASNPRIWDRDTNGWKDGEPFFLRCSVWRQQAESVAESLSRGTRVIATGKLSQRSYETQSGEKRTVVEMTVDEIGPSLLWATAKVEKVQRSGGQQQSRPAQQKRPQPADDPWATDDSDIPF